MDVSPGHRHDSVWFESAMNRVSIPGHRGAPLRRPRRLGGDKAYSYPRIRGWLRSRGIGIVIPTRTNQRRVQEFDRKAYRDRNVVERCVGWLKESRRVGTRYEKLARNFLAMVRVAIIRRLLRVLRRDLG